MEYTRILLKTDGPVARITLNRPEVHNAFDETVIAELADAFGELSGDSASRAVVLTGAGDSFCAGADLSWMQRMAAASRDENLADARKLAAMLQVLAECPKVTIARVNGAAIGGGVGLVAACDIAVAVQGAKFGLSEVRLGLAPAVIAPYVIEKIGIGSARALFLSGERITAAEAHRLGLVQQIVLPEDLDTVVNHKLESILQGGPKAIAAIKHLIRQIAGHTPEEAADLTIECIADLRASDEGQEGIRAFLEKRKAGFAE